MSEFIKKYPIFSNILLGISLVVTTANTVAAEEIDLTLTQQEISDRCGQVAGVNNSGTSVFKEPDVYSEQLGAIAEGRYVEIEGAPINGYFPVSIPLQGYIPEDFLTSCYTALPPQNCLQVAASGGIQIRQQPTENSQAVGLVDRGRNLRVEKVAAGNWVQVLAPLRGYAPTAQLTTCPPARFE